MDVRGKSVSMKGKKVGVRGQSMAIRGRKVGVRRKMVDLRVQGVWDWCWWWRLCFLQAVQG